MDIVVKFLLDHLPDPYIFPAFVLVFGWLAWSILYVCQWPHPKISTMLIYTVSVAIAFNLHLPRIRICTALADRCTYPLVWQRFISDVAFWFIVIYIEVIETFTKK